MNDMSRLLRGGTKMMEFLESVEVHRTQRNFWNTSELSKRKIKSRSKSGAYIVAVTTLEEFRGNLYTTEW